METTKQLRAIGHRVIAEMQPHGDFLVMFEDGTVRGYRNRAAVLGAITRRDRSEAAKYDNAAVMTTIEWRPPNAGYAA
jgi:hypothetical protein